MYKESFKTVIIEARKAAKLSKNHMAVKLRMSYPTYHKFEETGEISLDDYMNLCDMFDLCVMVIPRKSITSTNL